MNSCNEAITADLSQWLSREELRAERIDQRVAQALAAMLDLDSDTLEEGAELPPLLKFVEMTASTALQRHYSQSIKPYQGVLNG
jgi:hypothetical protein